MDGADGPAVALPGWAGLRTLRVERRPDGTEVRYLEGGYQWHLSVDGSQLIIADASGRPDAIPHWSRAAKRRAHQAVRRQIALGAWPAARDIRCADCGDGARDYHHPKGYDPQHHLDVVALCGRCHTRRHRPGWYD